MIDDGFNDLGLLIVEKQKGESGKELLHRLA